MCFPLSLGGVRFDGVSVSFGRSGATNGILYFRACLSCTDQGEFLEGPEDADFLTNAFNNAQEKGCRLRFRSSADSLDIPIFLLLSSNHATLYRGVSSFFPSSLRTFNIWHMHVEAEEPSPRACHHLPYHKPLLEILVETIDQLINPKWTCINHIPQDNATSTLDKLKHPCEKTKPCIHLQYATMSSSLHTVLSAGTMSVRYKTVVTVIDSRFFCM